MALAPPPINRLPVGLLSMLDIKSMGKNPNALSDVVQANVELNEFYINSASFISAYSDNPPLVPIPGGGGATGTLLRLDTVQAANPLPADPSGQIEVPDGEIWLVTEWCVSWSMTTANTLMLTPAIQHPWGITAGTPVPLSNVTMPLCSFLPTNAPGYARSNILRPVWLSSNDEPRVLIQSNTIAAPEVYTSVMKVARFQR